MKDVFISYSSQDQIAKDELIQLFDNEGITYWLDETSLGLGKNIQEEINKGLRESRFTILLVSRNSLLSTWVSYESLTRLKQEIFENKVSFIPIIIDEVVFDDNFPFEMHDKFKAEINRQNQLRQRAFDNGWKTLLYDSRIQRLQEILPQIPDIIHKILGGLSVKWIDNQLDTLNQEKLLNAIDEKRKARILAAQKQTEIEEKQKSEAGRQKEIKEKQKAEAEEQKKIQAEKIAEAQKQKEIQEKLKEDAKKQKEINQKPIVIDRRVWLGGGLVGLLGLFIILGQFYNLYIGKKITQNPRDTNRKTEIKSATNIDKFLPKMIYVEGGTFQMGDNNSQYDDEKPAHSVTLSSFYLAEAEVTQELYQAVMGINPSYFKNCPQCPVEQVSWDDAQAFIRRLNQLTGQNYRLPTEAQWEYAARGGNKSKNYKYAGSNDLNEVAWYDSNSSSKTHPVKQKKPNELGLYDMSGNVWEWCGDWYGDYSANAQNDPIGPANGTYRCLRGGSWNLNGYNSEVLDRDNYDPRLRANYYGFRLLRTP
jgi:formylglycine-generating enzyme required for sulfatase activity